MECEKYVKSRTTNVLIAVTGAVLLVILTVSIVYGKISASNRQKAEKLKELYDEGMVFLQQKHQAYSYYAILRFEDALKLDPDNNLVKNALQQAKSKYNRCYDYPAMFQEFYDNEIAFYTEAIQLDPNNKEAYNNRSAAYNYKRDYDKAIADADKAIQLDPDFAYPYRQRGFAYLRKSNYIKARADTNKSLQLDPNYQEAKALDAELRKSEEMILTNYNILKGSTSISR
jgi:tetratricopeptide (TPR) repeat protein